MWETVKTAGIITIILFINLLWGADGLTIEDGAGGQRIVKGEYNGEVMLELRINALDANGTVLDPSTWVQNLQTTWITANNEVRLSLNNNTLQVTGYISGPDAFPCTPERQENQTQILRGSSGYSQNWRNTGIYSRLEDWAVSVICADRRTILFDREANNRQFFTITAEGSPVTIKLIEDLYVKILGKSYYSPTHTLKSTVPSGWISWKAYKAGVTEDNIKSVTDWAAENLLDYGLEYIIVDDGWFHGSNGEMMHSVPEGVDWTKATSDRFPSGVQSLVDYVHNRGLMLGLWFSPFGCSDEYMANDHPDWWVRSSMNGDIILNGWHGAMMADGSEPEAVQNWITRGVRAQRAHGVDFFKCDGMRHVAYDVYSKATDYFSAKNTTWQEAMRTGWEGLITAADGGYVMSCWDRVPEIASIPHALRIGEDKESKWDEIVQLGDDLRKWFHEHNLVWCDDPDHMVFASINTAESRTWTSMVGITGTLLTFSDITDIYTDEKLDMLRRALPVIGNPIVRPCELYSNTETPPLWVLEITRDFDNWIIVANITAGSSTASKLDFETLGLDPSAKYTVYDFWKQRYLGEFSGSYDCGTPAEHDSQIFGIRKVQDTPWIIATNRHITQGGVDLIDVSWDDTRFILSGKSRVVNNDPYTITVHVPDGVTLLNAKFGSIDATLGNNNGARTLSFTPSSTGEISWSAAFNGPTRVRHNAETVFQPATVTCAVHGEMLTVRGLVSHGFPYTLTCHDVAGRELVKVSGHGNFNHLISVRGFGTGLHFIQLKSNADTIIKKVLYVK